MIDVHTHVLPAIDDGADSVETAVLLLEMLGKQGITDVIATPHFKPSVSGDIGAFIARRSQAYDSLMSQLAGRSDLPQIHLGAEATICVEMAEMDDLNKLCIEGTSYILTELDMSSFGSWVYNTLYEMRIKQSVTPIIAHIDRYIHILRKSAIDDIIKLGCPVQFNISGLFHRSVRKDLVNLIHRYPEQICLVGSDCHDMLYRKPEWTKFTRKADKMLGDGFLGYIYDRSSKLINGKLIY